jgi:DNA-binding MarR family transcriptional regulator
VPPDGTRSGRRPRSGRPLPPPFDLVGRGFALRKPDPADGRRNIVVITRRGAGALARLDAVVDDVQDAVLAPLQPSERVTLVRLLAKLT